MRLRGSLEGPTPWRIKGKASVSILFFSIDVNVCKTWGENADTTLAGIAAMPLLRSELESDTNWQADLPAGNKLLVSLRDLNGSGDALVLHPLGRLRVSQRKMPLDLSITKIGNQKVIDAKKFTLKVDTSDLKKVSDQSELFAKAQYQDLNNTTKLSLPAFQPMTGGLLMSVDGKETRSSQLIKRNVRYELTTIDNNFKKFTQKFFVFWAQLFTHFTFGAAITKVDGSFAQEKKLQPFETKIVASQPAYQVANTDDNKPFAGSIVFQSEASAHEYMTQQIEANPGLAQAIHVIPQYEVNE